MSNSLDEPADDWLPGADVTQAIYARWRDARRGDSHAVNMNNPVWEWLIRTRISAYMANRHFHGPDSLVAGPAWCFSRYGQSRTVLPDGRVIYVAGEHEDFYDPDFYIYNDVVVMHPDDRIDIHGYRASGFPPTDFHSATLLGDKLILVGSLGYVEQRQPGSTQVLSLDVHSLRIGPIETTGENPGWIFSHRASLVGDRIMIQGGELQTESGVIENIDDWMLDLNSWIWTRMTDRQWPRFEFMRSDGEMNHLWQIRHELDMRKFQSQCDLTAETQESIRQTLELVSTAGLPFQPDPQLLDQLYRPEVEHEPVARDKDDFEEHNVFRIQIDGVVVRYVEDSHAIVLTVEGSLPSTTLDRLVADMQGKLTRIENAEFTVRRW